MNIRDLPVDLTAFSGVDRTEGLHITDVINAHVQEQYDLVYPESTDAEKQAAFEAGFTWERLLSRAYADRLPVRTREIEWNGIYASPDGVDDDAVHEYKFTKLSLDKTPDQNIRWMMQAMWYCWVCSRTVVIFHVLHVNGDYRKNRGYTAREYEITFTEQELEENYLTLTGFAKSKGWIE